MFHNIIDRQLHPISNITLPIMRGGRSSLSRASINYNPMAEPNEWNIGIRILRRIQSDKVAERLIYADLRTPANLLAAWRVASHSAFLLRRTRRVVRLVVLASLCGPFSRQPTLVPKGPKREAGLKQPLSHALTYGRERPTTKSNTTRDVENAFVWVTKLTISRRLLPAWNNAREGTAIRDVK